MTSNGNKEGGCGGVIDFYILWKLSSVIPLKPGTMPCFKEQLLIFLNVLCLLILENCRLLTGSWGKWLQCLKVIEKSAFWVYYVWWYLVIYNYQNGATQYSSNSWLVCYYRNACSWKKKLKINISVFSSFGKIPQVSGLGPSESSVTTQNIVGTMFC